MDTTSIQAKRLQSMIDTTNFREPEKVPTAILATTWAFAYAGTTYRAVIDDPAAAAEAYTKFVDDLNIDFAMTLGIPLAVRTFEALNSTVYYLANDDTCISHGQALENYISEEDYDLLISNPEYVINDLFIKNRCPVFKGPRDEAVAAMRKALPAFKNFAMTNMLIGQKGAEKGVVSVWPSKAPSFYSGFNFLFDRLRGVKNSLIDLRRMPNKVKAACDSIIDWTTAGYKTDVAEIKRDFGDDPLPFGSTVYHSECFLSPKMYDELFFKDFKKHCEPYMEAGAKFFLLGEGSFMNTLDRFRQLPKGSMIIMLEQDDPFEAYKIIGDYQTLVTGISVDLLKHGTKQQCLDYVKKSFDTFAPGGGFIFSPNMTLIAANDVNIDNLLAVYDFANSYGKK
ncbi:hypothetical protein [Eubacterium sp. 1001713B170207_170306_E7]|uniref:hypothetical protein n=1 Tax=Eubacterium sp. 1001713B170207_170306_E7 TaxID=2787097 RepID=UPI00189BD393|nr:hypothetical protein [Eubacterium sp. 1001713B170207_170306_E7]